MAFGGCLFAGSRQYVAAWPPPYNRCMLGFLFGNYGRMYSGPAIGGGQMPTNVSGVATHQFLHLQQRVDSLELACAALWRLLKVQNGFTDEQLQALIQQIDGEDGAMDGKISRQGGVCPHCQHRVLSRTAGKCLWCGAPLNEGPFNEAGGERSQ
jgi:hypothetical protein